MYFDQFEQNQVFDLKPVHITKELMLSFAEIYPIYDNNWEKAWGDYTVYGGIPLVFTYKKEEDKVKYLKNLFKETYLKDIIERNRIKSTDELEELLNILASNIGSLVNPQKLTATFKSVKKVPATNPQKIAVNNFL